MTVSGYNPRSGDIISSNGTIINEADGMNPDGSKNIQVIGSKVIGPTKIASVPYTTFLANSTQYPNFMNKLNRAATHRTFWIINTMDQAFSSNPSLAFFDSVIGNSNATGSDIVAFSGLTAGGGKQYKTSEANPALATHTDSCFLTCAMGATAPTTGTLDVWVVEILGS